MLFIWWHETLANGPLFAIHDNLENASQCYKICTPVSMRYCYSIEIASDQSASPAWICNVLTQFLRIGHMSLMSDGGIIYLLSPVKWTRGFWWGIPVSGWSDFVLRGPKNLYLMQYIVERVQTRQKDCFCNTKFLIIAAAVQGRRSNFSSSCSGGGDIIDYFRRLTLSSDLLNLPLVYLTESTP